MSPYRKVRDTLGLTHETGTSQNFHLLYLLLSALADQDEALGPVSVTFADPAKEVLFRLRNYDGFGLQELQRTLVPMVK